MDLSKCTEELEVTAMTDFPALKPSDGATRINSRRLLASRIIILLLVPVFITTFLFEPLMLKDFVASRLVSDGTNHTMKGWADAEEETPKIVIGMGVCLSKEAQRITQKEQAAHHHEGKPYDVSAILATRLWKQQNPNLKVVVALVVPQIEGYEPEINITSRQIRGAGGEPWIVPTDFSVNPDTASVRASQLARAFVHESGLVHDDDMLVTADSDAFPISVTRRLEPLEFIPDVYRVWISNYGHAASTNDAFPLSFIGMQSKDWRDTWKQMGEGCASFMDVINRAVNGTGYTVSRWTINVVIRQSKQ